ncbi:hypothetical protein [Flavobacterium sp. CS20]|jgi:hypothetical protein|uniref:hypothetical protein n=1 Tax=Flavobacterium sp. CS20 TaxID=2775246 RepID=UPI001B3A1685|nr:hypothetical protein [Flavobacterium sp. CS20]QTY27544.1 hypothetical protein IGB25_03040 [Flavobacterium sp. CS20]
MNRQLLIEDAVKKINKLPDVKLQEINDFVDFLLRKIDDKIILENIQELTSKSNNFLNDEEDLYDESDLKEKF